MDLSVIIVNYNVRFFLEQCLNSVRQASVNIDCEVIVVDNNSADGSCSMVINQFPEVRLIRNNKNVGYSTANNQAIRLSKGDYILLLNPDTFVEENTFIKCLMFMREHQDAGALGVRMINGNGKLLPESKRGMPTPAAALFRLSGLYAVFPKSPRINKYYLGHLDSSITTEVEIISGAFMFLRKKVIDKTGLLDETFFMYGEDIDLSYRILKAGFKNYYFPEVKIIHYKGESTRKSDFNYTIIFYKAMLIFAKKHFSEKKHFVFLLLINIAIYLRGLIAIGKNISKRIALPLLDTFLLCGSIGTFIWLWEMIKFGGENYYPLAFKITAVAAFTVTTLLSIKLTGGYKVPAKLRDTFDGALISSVLIMAVYSILPLELRFSRFIVLWGVFSSLAILPAFKLILALAGSDQVQNPLVKARRILIIGDKDGYNNVESILKSKRNDYNLIGRVSLTNGDSGPEVLGNLNQIRDVIRINKVVEIIFSTREMTTSQIINSMYHFSDINITIKIAPPGEGVIIGSKSVEFTRDIYSDEGNEGALKDILH